MLFPLLSVVAQPVAVIVVACCCRCYLLLLAELLRGDLSLLPSLVDAEERRGAVHPLDESGARAQRRHRVVARVQRLTDAPAGNTWRGHVVSTRGVNT